MLWETVLSVSKMGKTSKLQEGVLLGEPASPPAVKTYE